MDANLMLVTQLEKLISLIEREIKYNTEFAPQRARYMTEMLNEVLEDYEAYKSENSELEGKQDA